MSARIEIKRCARCVLPVTTPYIKFDEHGVCNYCRSHTPILYKGEEALLKRLEEFRDANKKYECLVAISGGRDSTYTLLKMVKDYHLKVLAVHYDNPFADIQAQRNIENAVAALHVDLIKVKSRKGIHEKTYRHNLQTWSKQPYLEDLPLMCVACKLMWYEMFKVALKYGIRLIVAGDNRYEDTSYIKALVGVPITDPWEKTFVKSFFGVLKGVMKNPRYLKPSFWPVYLKAYFFGDPYALGFRLFSHRVTLLDLFYYVEWKEEEVLSRIQSELNWKPSPTEKSTWRFDCHVALIKDLVYLTLFGLTEKDDFYSKMIREGLLARQAALARLEKENEIPVDTARNILAWAGIEYDDFLERLKKHPLAKR